MIAPTLQTARLTLRAPKPADVAHGAAFFAAPRPTPEGGPLDRAAPWRAAAADVARTVMARARTRLGGNRLITLIDPANTRSIAPGRRLGAVIERTLAGIDPGDGVIRHDPRPAA